LKQSFNFLLVALGQVATEERAISNGVAATRAVEYFQARKRIKHIEREEPGKAQAEPFEVVIGEMLAGELIKKEGSFEAGTGGPTGDGGGILGMPGGSVFRNSIGWK
jgi:hypothetical protein